MDDVDPDEELARAAARLASHAGHFAPDRSTLFPDPEPPGRLTALLDSLRDHRGIVITVVLALLAVLITVGVTRRDDLASRTRVAVVGDSLTAQSSWAIDDRLGADGYVVAVAGRNGATIGDQYQQAISYTGFDGAQVLVVALGTNNAFFVTVDDDRHVSAAQTREQIDRLVHDVLQGPPDRTWQVSVQCLVWVNLREDTTGYTLDAQAPPVNAEIASHAAAEADQGRQMLVADWASRSRGRAEWFVADGVHLTAEGQAAYAELIAETVARCDG